MNSKKSIALAIFLISTISAPSIALAADSSAAKPAASKAAAAKPAAKPAAKAATPTANSKADPNNNETVVKERLDAFAMSCGADMNKNLKPCSIKKEVVKKGNEYQARYMEIDLKSMQTSFNKPESSKTIAYVGYMNYQEVEYVCTAPTEKEALAGPFKEIARKNLTELIKYKSGKWTY